MKYIMSKRPKKTPSMPRDRRKAMLDRTSAPQKEVPKTEAIDLDEAKPTQVPETEAPKGNPIEVADAPASSEAPVIDPKEEPSDATSEKTSEKKEKFPVVAVDDIVMVSEKIGKLNHENVALYLGSLEFNKHLAAIEEIRDRTTSILDVLIPGHLSSRFIVKSLWEAIYNNFQKQDMQRIGNSIEEFTSYAAGIQKLMSTQVNLENIEMKRLEFEKDNHQMLEYLRYVAYFRENPQEARKSLSPDIVKTIESECQLI